MNRVTAGAVTINKDGDERFEPLWPSFVAMLAVGGLYAALPAYLLGGAPRWLLAAIVVAMLVPILILHRRHNHTLSQKLGLCAEQCRNRRLDRLACFPDRAGGGTPSTAATAFAFGSGVVGIKLILMMIQALISLLVIALLAGRAVNIL